MRSLLCNFDFPVTPIIWLRNALLNLETIHGYYMDQEVPDQAKKIIKFIELTVNQLIQFPGLGRPGRVAKTRELLVSQTPYLIIYREHKNEVQILRVLHSAQKWPRAD